MKVTNTLEWAEQMTNEKYETHVSTLTKNEWEEEIKRDNDNHAYYESNRRNDINSMCDYIDEEA